jgi:hypothetical protein
VDNSGNVFVTGISYGGASGNDYATVAYSSAGAVLWTKHYNGPANGDDAATAVAVDRNGDVFVTGSSTGSGTGCDYATIKYSSSILPAHLDFQSLNNQLVLSWANSDFSLQFAAAITGTFTNIPGATSPYTNTITTSQQYFRLKMN